MDAVDSQNYLKQLPNLLSPVGVEKTSSRARTPPVINPFPQNQSHHSGIIPTRTNETNSTFTFSPVDPSTKLTTNHTERIHHLPSLYESS